MAKCEAARYEWTRMTSLLRKTCSEQWIQGDGRGNATIMDQDEGDGLMLGNNMIRWTDLTQRNILRIVARDRETGKTKQQ